MTACGHGWGPGNGVGQAITIYMTKVKHRGETLEDQWLGTKPPPPPQGGLVFGALGGGAGGGAYFFGGGLFLGQRLFLGGGFFSGWGLSTLCTRCPSSPRPPAYAR